MENVNELEISSPFVKIPIHRDKYQDKKEFSDVFNQLRSKHKIMRNIILKKQMMVKLNTKKLKSNKMRL